MSWAICNAQEYFGGSGQIMGLPYVVFWGHLEGPLRVSTQGTAKRPHGERANSTLNTGMRIVNPCEIGRIGYHFYGYQSQTELDRRVTHASAGTHFFGYFAARGIDYAGGRMLTPDICPKVQAHLGIITAVRMCRVVPRCETGHFHVLGPLLGASRRRLVWAKHVHRRQPPL